MAPMDETLEFAKLPTDRLSKEAALRRLSSHATMLQDIASAKVEQPAATARLVLAVNDLIRITRDLVEQLPDTAGDSESIE